MPIIKTTEVLEVDTRSASVLVEHRVVVKFVVGSKGLQVLTTTAVHEGDEASLSLSDASLSAARKAAADAIAAAGRHQDRSLSDEAIAKILLKNSKDLGVSIPTALKEFCKIATWFDRGRIKSVYAAIGRSNQSKASRRAETRKRQETRQDFKRRQGNLFT
ncbi:MAG: hypothetical protein KGJ34_02320 [Patescibacteria group bacterium]|nr:hypothetical protein [Patescibacteria group bacterium]